MSVDRLSVRIQSMIWEAEGVIQLELCPLGGMPLPAFTAGSHIDVHLPLGFSRSYSLVNPATDANRYVIAVQEDPQSRGGSRYLTREARPGDILTVSPPRNNFKLTEDAVHTVFVAGGIGITPFIPMMLRLAQLGRTFELHYCVKVREKAPLVAAIAAMQVDHDFPVHMYFSREKDGRRIDLGAVAAAVPDGAHIYCCGPNGMIEELQAMTADRPAGHVHVEHFASLDAPATEGGYVVELRRQGLQIAVQKGQTILDAMLARGLDVPHSCVQGVCGACETAIIEGEPDHRDVLLSAEERASNRTMMICCSGSKSTKLVLDL